VPPILAVGAADAHFDRQRFAARQRGAPCSVVSFGIGRVEMRKSLCTWARRLFQREAHVILPSPIDEAARPVGPIHRDEHRDGVDRQPQVTLGFLKAGLAAAQRVLGALALVDLATRFDVRFHLQAMLPTDNCRCATMRHSTTKVDDTLVSVEPTFVAQAASAGRAQGAEVHPLIPRYRRYHRPIASAPRLC
jgi:hypothetical protein